MKMKGRQLNMTTRQGANTVIPLGYKLNIAREGFIYRRVTIFNKLDENIRNETKLNKFKEGVKKWVRENIPIKPKPAFECIPEGSVRSQPPPQPPEPPPLRCPPPNQRSILNYFPSK